MPGGHKGADRRPGGIATPIPLYGLHFITFAELANASKRLGRLSASIFYAGNPWAPLSKPKGGAKASAFTRAITLRPGATSATRLSNAHPDRRSRPIGYLGSSSELAQSRWVAAFVQRLQLGWIEGRTIAIEYRWAEGRAERFAEIAAEFSRLKVDVIVTAGTAPVLAAKQATSKAGRTWGLRASAIDDPATSGPLAPPRVTALGSKSGR